MFEFENKYKAKGLQNIAGMDEVGRGPLAGPVTVACVIMPLDDASIISGINDSKKLTPKKREELAIKIKEKALAYNIVCVSPQRIDEINILNATKDAMVQCVAGMSLKSDMVLVDFVPNPAFTFNFETIKQGDAKSYSIACASIIAKVYRDNLMLEMAQKYPQYQFEKHKGYGTKLHIELLEKFGACPEHRQTFLKNFKVG